MNKSEQLFQTYAFRPNYKHCILHCYEVCKNRNNKHIQNTKLTQLTEGFEFGLRKRTEKKTMDTTTSFMWTARLLWSKKILLALACMLTEYNCTTNFSIQRNLNEIQCPAMWGAFRRHQPHAVWFFHRVLDILRQCLFISICSIVYCKLSLSASVQLLLSSALNL